MKSEGTSQQKPLRLWPGVVIVITTWLAWLGLPLAVPGNTATMAGILAGLLGGLAVVLWWIFFSRAARSERWGAIAMAVIALAVTSRFLHPSIATAMMGMMFVFYAIPVMSFAFVAWAVVTHRYPDGFRRAALVATILLSSGGWILLRTDGMTGEAQHDFAWRWAETAEDRLLSRPGNKFVPMPMDSAALSAEAEWPGFRGPRRDGIVHGAQIGADWAAIPPVEIWRKAVGPGCSSVAIHGNVFYTQEQRGEYELVTCYMLSTGEPVWEHRDSTRFWDAHAGAGPRSTPTLSAGRVYTLGATGILNVLDARNGAVVWSCNAARDARVKLPGWGYPGSPLVSGGVVLVAVAGKLIGYDILTGKQRWSGTDGGESYSSPHLMTIDGVEQVVFMNNAGIAGYTLVDGSVLWTLPWPGARIVQPAMTSDGDLLVSAPDGSGLRRMAVSRGTGGWTTRERWTSDGIKPYFNDFVVHKGYAYGYDAPGLACIDLRDGKRQWKGGRYGGQILLLADQDLILVLSEKGELALVKATPDRFTELARVKSIEGKTWNHPAMAGDILVVRNTREMVAYRLPAEGVGKKSP